ncbi:class I glutamine amidotransferase-like protein [Hygrophoropsis aurantiaca]|uniref:Class I glutamine amidotransferase-like protein n=1 Tax=Hygrophoropsis aurantiaca TaxID=72124 RepID=A0ACB7ZYZ5_9AGAM|nr:class I glutamine amidotransferase-like protein [Hygrophoropsis aurantiaca]
MGSIPQAKIALLVCDPTSDAFVEAHGDIPALFTGLYTTLFTRLTQGQHTDDLKITRQGSFVTETMASFQGDTFRSFSVINGELPDDVDEYTAVIVSGSAVGVNDADKYTWIPKLADFLHDTATNHPKVKIIGICFGHQIICNSILKDSVQANPKGWEIGPCEVDLTETGKVLFPGKDSLAPEAPPSPPPETVIRTTKTWGETEKTDNEGIVSWTGSTLNSVDDIHIFTSQGHPELTQEMTTTLVDLFEAEIDAKAVEEARKCVADFKGDLDRDYIALLMWALSTGHSYVFSNASSFNA